MNGNDNMFQMYQNSGYRNPRNRKRTLILDIDDTDSGDTHLGSGGEFNIELYEPLIIDKDSEVYLDNFITFNCNITNTIDNAAFALKINEFNINSTVASSNRGGTIYNSIIIPNEHNNNDNNHTVVVHKGKKFNYICDINPSTISSLTGKLTNLNGGPTFHSTNPASGFTYTLTGIDDPSGWNHPLEPGNIITSIIISTEDLLTGTLGATLLLSHSEIGGDIHFASDVSLTTAAFLGANTTITIVINDGDTIIIPTGTNNNVQLIKGSGRFIAEFSIISRE